MESRSPITTRLLLRLTQMQSPKLSMLVVHQMGHGSRVSSRDSLSGFGSQVDIPDYAQIAVAVSAGWA
jgi:hypothetical protein